MTASSGRFYDPAAAATDRSTGFYARWVLRSASFPVSRLCLAIRSTPNQITVVGTALGLLAAGLAVLGGRGALLAAGGVLHVAKVMDYVDGNLARAYGRKTWLGKFLDGLSDALVDSAFLAGVGLGVGGAVALFAVGAAWVSTLGLYAKVRHLYLLGKVRPAEPAEAAPMEGEAATVSRAARLARGVVVVLERLDHELALPGFVLAAGVGRVDWWVVGAGSLRLLTGATAVAKATYAGVVTLNLPRG
jgi:phosphatidylglycerophosphate synthase